MWSCPAESETNPFRVASHHHYRISTWWQSNFQNVVNHWRIRHIRRLHRGACRLSARSDSSAKAASYTGFCSRRRPSGIFLTSHLLIARKSLAWRSHSLAAPQTGGLVQTRHGGGVYLTVCPRAWIHSLIFVFLCSRSPGVGVQTIASVVVCWKLEEGCDG